MENTTSSENTKEIDKAFEFDESKYKHSRMEGKITTYIIAHDEV